MKLGLASDHAGFKLKESFKQYLTTKGYTIVDYGCNSEESVDYPDFAHPLALAVENNAVDLGIEMCGSGNGINMTANKHQGIRAALCWLPEIASLAKQHNDANILTLPARYLSKEKAFEILDAFLTADFEGGRHLRRVEKISC